MAISASDVKKLREMTGAGMMDCKKALTETDGDFDAAIDFLRKKGLASAEKKAGRIAAEGVVATFISDDAKTATILEVNSETDFVAKNEVFTTYVEGLAKQINDNDYADVAALNAAQSAIEPSETVEAQTVELKLNGEDLSDENKVTVTLPNTWSKAGVEGIEAGAPHLVCVEITNEKGPAWKMGLAYWFNKGDELSIMDSKGAPHEFTIKEEGFYVVDDFKARGLYQLLGVRYWTTIAEPEVSPDEILTIL